MRSATSRRRVSARTSRRLATFTQAMSSTSPTIAHSVHSTGRTLPTTSSRYGCTSGTRPASRSVFAERKSASVGDARQQLRELARRLLGRHAGAESADSRRVESAEVVAIDAHWNPELRRRVSGTRIPPA